VRTRSITGPLILVAVGVLFLMNNIRPDFSPFAMISRYWPFLLIGAGVVGLVEVLYYVSRGVTSPPSPLGGGWIFWIVVWCVIAGVASDSHDIRIRSFDDGGVGFFGSSYDYDVAPLDSPQVASQGVTRIVLDNIRGNLSLRGDDSGDVKVTGHKSIRAFSRQNADRANQQSSLEIRREGDILLIHAVQPERAGTFQISTDLDIVIPKGIGVEARGRSGDLNVDDVDGAVSVTAGKGDVRLTRIGKDVKIEGSRGGTIHASDLKGGLELDGRGSDVELENIAGDVTINGEYLGTLEFRALAHPLRFESSRTEFHVEAIPGSIRLDLGDLKMNNVSGPVRFSTGTRDIEATDVTNGLDLTVNRGDINVTASKSPLPKIDIHSHNGDIVLSLPDKAGFELKGSTSQGEVENDFGSQLQTQTSGRTATIQGQTGSGPQIVLTTDRGTVSIKKL
jgi:DUF4097 and DUF4098 domain-containing protein YvlB